MSHQTTDSHIEGNSMVSSEALSGRPLANLRVLIIVENLAVPFDRRVWQEARTLHAAGAQVSVICPIGQGFNERYELLEGIHVYRHKLPVEATGVFGYLVEYGFALFWETILAWRIFFTRGFDVIHACNPPDLIFLVALPFRLIGVKFLFDHHDVNPEMYEAKFGKRGGIWRLLLWFERLTFALASVSIATNDSFRKIAIERGRMKPEDVFVVRSGPDLSRIKAVPANPAWKRGREYLVGYVGVVGPQEGMDLLLAAVHHLVHEKKIEKIQFLLVCVGPSVDKFRQIAADMGLSEYVIFTGRVPDHDMLEILSTADVCICPDPVNRMTQISTMNKIMEYMALGKPIVQFDLCEGRRSAQEAALYAKANDPVDFANKVEKLLADGHARAQMGEFGRRRIERELSWEQSIPPLVAAYQRIQVK